MNMSKSHHRAHQEVTDWSSLQPGDAVAISDDLHCPDPAYVEITAPELGVLWIRRPKIGERRLLHTETHRIWRLVPNSPS
jgi:hypothetical protein